MQRWVSIVLGLVAIGLAFALTWQSMSRWRPAKLETDGGAAIHDAGVAATTVTPVADVDADLGFYEPVAPREFHDGGVGFVMPDGSPVPPLPASAPRRVRFGVVLVTYAGSEEAPPHSRSRKDALELADKLAAQAKTDFHAAVRRGDDGSGDDVGSIRQGVLEPAAEFVLFSLPVGGVSDPVDTPRGYWIVKRIE